MTGWCEFLPGQRLGDDRTVGGLDRDADHLLALSVLEETRHAGDGAAGADTRHQDIDLAAGVLPDLRAGGALVDGRVGRVLELLRDDGVGQRRGKLVGLGDGAELLRENLHSGRVPFLQPIDVRRCVLESWPVPPHDDEVPRRPVPPTLLFQFCRQFIAQTSRGPILRAHLPSHLAQIGFAGARQLGNFGC